MKYKRNDEIEPVTRLLSDLKPRLIHMQEALQRLQGTMIIACIQQTTTKVISPEVFVEECMASLLLHPLALV